MNEGNLIVLYHNRGIYTIEYEQKVKSMHSMIVATRIRMGWDIGKIFNDN